MHEYEIGDFVSKPVTGICKIENILYLNLQDENSNKLYYLMKPIEDEKENMDHHRRGRSRRRDRRSRRIRRRGITAAAGCGKGEDGNDTAGTERGADA